MELVPHAGGGGAEGRRSVREVIVRKITMKERMAVVIMMAGRLYSAVDLGWVVVESSFSSGRKVFGSLW